MTNDVRKFLTATPFKPFVIVTSAGSKYPVPTQDHAGTNPRGSRVVVWFDDDSGVTISALQIASIEEVPTRRKAA